jgi:signal transduction histidine kinase
MKPWEVVLRLLLLAYLACGNASAFAQDASNRKNILYLSTEGLDNRYFTLAYQAFKSELNIVLPQKTLVYVENLDLARFNGKDYQATLAAWLRTKYAGTRFDAIVTVGTPAMRFAAESQLWPTVPTYFSHANADTVGQIALSGNFTGQTYALNLARTYALIRQLFPNTKRIALVGNVGDVYRPTLDQDLKQNDSFGLIDLRGKSLDEVLRRVGSLDDDTVVYRTGFSRAPSGQLYDSIALFELISARANRPVFVDYSPLIGIGALGGIAVDADIQSRNAARQVARLLDGVAPSAMPRTRLDFHPTFDWRQLQRWHVADGRLPPSSQVWFHTPTLWEMYRWQILAVLSGLVVLTLLVAALLVERRLRARAVAESRARLAELAHLNRNATAMVYSGAIAHELNQPLAAILANAQAARMMLGTAAPALDDIREILEDIERDDRRASDLIKGMRGLLKKGEVRHEVLDMQAVIASAVRFIRAEAAMRSVTIQTRLPSSPAQVLGDRVQLQQVLINLIINGIDAMSELPAQARTIEIAAAVGADTVDVSVSDAGPGFQQATSEVFQSFITTKAHGTGLGLAITAALVREHGGQIQARNLEGRGARVSFSLPLLAPPSAAQGARAAASSLQEG